MGDKPASRRRARSTPPAKPGRRPVDAENLDPGDGAQAMFKPKPHKRQEPHVGVTRKATLGGHVRGLIAGLRLANARGVALHTAAAPPPETTTTTTTTTRENARTGDGLRPGKKAADVPPPVGGRPPRRGRTTKASRRRRQSDQPYETCDFLKVSVVGEGAFGCVFAAVHARDPKRRVVAVKVLDKKKVLESGQVALTFQERRILQTKHPFIVRATFAFQTYTQLFYGMPLYPTSLAAHVAKRGCGGVTGARLYAAEIALALGHLHALNVVHRDVKPSNVLVDPSGHVAVADFGLAAPRGRRDAAFCGTPEYAAPEIFRKGTYACAPAVDFWSLGVLLYELLADGRLPFAGRAEDMFKAILWGAPPPTGADILFDAHVLPRLLDKNAETRLSTVDALKRLAFFGDLDWDAVYRRACDPPGGKPDRPDFLAAAAAHDDDDDDTRHDFGNNTHVGDNRDEHDDDDDVVEHARLASHLELPTETLEHEDDDKPQPALHTDAFRGFAVFSC